MLTKDLAICIRAVDYSETSQIVTFFTRATGKISAIAKGSKRPKSTFDGPIEVFSHGKIVFSNSNKNRLATLTEFEQQSSFSRLAENLFVSNCSFFAVELINLLTEEYDPHPGLFDSFLQFLQKANEQRTGTNSRQDTLSLLILFQLTLLKEVGLELSLKTCANCKTNFSADWPEVYFSSLANGLICRDCEDSFPDKMRLTNTTASSLSNLNLLVDSQEKTLDEIEKFLVHHFTELLHKRPKMAKYVSKI